MYTAEPKIDSISASITYKDGKLITGVSRGDSNEGEVIFKFSYNRWYSKKYFNKDFPEEIDIRGEVFMQNSDFESLKDKFANPRNAASGSLRQKNPEIPKRFH